MPTTKSAAPKISESRWSDSFKILFKTLGWEGYHTYRSKRSEPGYPDWTLFNVKQQRVIFVELKTDTGKVSSAQKHWIDSLRQCGQEVYVWRPSDYDAAVAILKRQPNDIPLTDDLEIPFEVAQ